MADVLNTIPDADKIATGVKSPVKIAEALGDCLADTYRLLFKTHAYHWNVEGPLFFGLHHLTEEQYEDLFEAADVVAERMRALGQLTPMTMDEIMKRSEITDLAQTPSAREMVEDLAADHAKIATRLHKLIELADKNNDPVTADLATARSTFHEKAAWMLRATAAE